MPKEKETIKRIAKHYASCECVQVMCPYKDSITIFDKHNIIYHHAKDSSVFINEYIEDNRKKEFPYHNIPTHCSKSKFNYKIHKTNQLFNYEQPYIIISGGTITECFVVKDNKEDLLVSKNLLVFDENYIKTKIMTRNEVDNFLNPPTNNPDKRFFLDLNGVMRKDNKIKLPTEDSIYENARESLLTDVKNFREYTNLNPSSTIGSYLIENPLFLNFVENSAKNSDLKDLKLNMPLIRDNIVILVKLNNSNITIQGINIIFIKSDCYKVKIVDIPVTKYTLNQIKYLATDIIPMKEPKISLKLNPGLTKEDLNEAKQMIYNKK